MDDLKTKWSIPQCIRAGDGKQVRIKKLPNSRTKTLAQYLFLWLLMQTIGSCTLKSAHLVKLVMPHFGISQNSEEDLEIKLNIRPSKTIEGVKLPPFVLKDQAFALKTTLMKLFQNKDITHRQSVCNYCFSRARRVVENCFGHLAQRFR